MNKLNEFTTEQLVQELKNRPETEVVWRNTDDDEEFYFGDMDYYLNGKGIILIIRNSPIDQKNYFRPVPFFTIK